MIGSAALPPTVRAKYLFAPATLGAERRVKRPQFLYRVPDFSAAPFSAAPEARFVPAPADGVLPDGFFSTTNLPTYVKANGAWRRPRLPRMDCVIVRDPSGELISTEPRRVTRGTPVALGSTEDGSEGIFVHGEGFLGGAHSANEFRFMQTAVSREKPVDYAVLADLLGEERARGGTIVWVVGPALVHARAREDLIWFIERGYVGALLGGNAVAVHDLEAAIFGTTLGMSSSGEGVAGGHALHMRAINAIRKAGSIEAAVTQGIVQSGIMHALIARRVPYVLAGSIRDDGPLPGVLSDTLAAQDAMRDITARATFAVFVATALHAIAVGNMLPAFVDAATPDDVRPLTTICVDQTEFVVNKLRDRGTHQAFGVVTNAQDFMHVLRFYVERWEQARTQTPATSAPSR
jgi:lysine-ketoglutarate reductase/saccharopine dehydrogenase-like protein (TIGR00300 family)